MKTNIDVNAPSPRGSAAEFKALLRRLRSFQGRDLGDDRFYAIAMSCLTLAERVRVLEGQSTNSDKLIKILSGLEE